MPANRKKSVQSIGGWIMRIKKKIPTRKETIFYCVERYTKHKCPASFAVSDETGALRVIQPHLNHENDKLVGSVHLARQSLKENAHSGSCREVIDGVRAAFSTDTSLKIGSYDKKRRIIHYEKSHSNADMKLMDGGGKICKQFSETLEKGRFLLVDEVINGKRFIVFASDVGLEILLKGHVVFVDGTFECTPKGFCQLFSFHCYISPEVVRPAAFALLPDKQLSTYSTLLDLMKSLPELYNWNPGMVISDYEAAIHAAFKVKFPNIIISGCMFHLIKNWRRQAEKCNVYQEFIDGNYEEFWQLLKTLPFVDETNIPDYFSIIVDHCVPLAVTPGMNQFIDYIVDNYVGKSGMNPPRFHPSIWSCATRVSSDIHRTTNVVEVWHRLLQSVATLHNGFSTLKLSDLLKKLQQEEQHTSLDYRELQIDPDFKVKKSRQNSNVLKDKRLKEAVDNIPVIPRAPLSGIPYLKKIFFAKKD